MYSCLFLDEILYFSKIEVKEVTPISSDCPFKNDSDETNGFVVNVNFSQWSLSGEGIRRNSLADGEDV
jgi:hypothetical protein